MENSTSNISVSEGTAANEQEQSTNTNEATALQVASNTLSVDSDAPFSKNNAAISTNADAINSSPLIMVVHASVGSGHKSAAEAIALGFELLRDHPDEAQGEPVSIPANTRVEVHDILDYGRIKFDGDSTASMFTGVTRPFYDLTWRFTFTGRLLWGGGTIWARIMFPKFVEYVQTHKPAAIVCTHITAANVAVSARMILGETFPIICVPTDYEVEGLWPHASTDLFCVANEQMAETLRPRGVPEDHILITGIPPKPAFRQTYDKAEVRKSFGLPQDKRITLFLAGASLPRPYVHFREALDVLLPYLHSFKNMQAVVVAGKDIDYATRLRRSVKDLRLDNVVVYDFVNDMPALMAASDLIVCKSGGLTVTECLCAQTPMLLLGRAYGQEKANTTLLTSAGAALHVTTARELVDELRQIEDHPQMTEAVLINASLMRKPDAALDIARATIKLINAPKNPKDKFYKKRFVKFYWGGKPAHVR
jgi:processive 1,2-diacylglycerol beta-glucosyltransferase